MKIVAPEGKRAKLSDTSISSSLSLAKGNRTYVFSGMYNSIYDFPDIISINYSGIMRA